MSNLDVLAMALRNLLKRKLRTSLTVFGVIIGVVSIVLMISLGIGINISFEKQIENMGDLTILEIYSNAYYGYDKSAPAFDDEMIAKISKIPGVKAVSPYVNFSLTVLDGRYSSNIQIIGLDPKLMVDLGYKTTEGSLLSSEETDAYEIVYGSDVAQTFLSDLDRKKQGGDRNSGGMRSYGGFGIIVEERGGMGGMGEVAPTINVNLLKDRVTASYDYRYGQKDATYTDNKKPDSYLLKGVGILQKSTTDYRVANSSFMDYKKVLQMKKDQEKYQVKVEKFNNQTKTVGYEQGIIKAEAYTDVENIIKELKDLGINAYSPMEYITQMKEMMGSLQGLLAAIGAVSLFVAAIGIANTMIMSIYERTREIGIMKVIGASLKDIQKLFLVEAALIGVLGGVLGIGFSFLGSFVINNVGISFFNQFSGMMYYGENQKSTISYIPIWLALSALLFATLIGLVSGFLPARRAMNLSALSAIKSE